MKILTIRLIAGAILLSLLQFQYGSCQSYDGNLVEVTQMDYEGLEFNAITMSRKGKRVSAKYFAGPSNDGTPVDERYRRWAANRNIILATSGTYMNKCSDGATPVGMTIDNGVTVNRNFKPDFGGLVIVYATGGVVASKIKEGNLSMQCNGSYTNFDVRDSGQRTRFMRCAGEVDATVFQAHLLAWKNELTVSPPSSSISGSGNKAERRYLIVGTDYDGNVKHSVTHVTQEVTLYEGAVKVKAFAHDYLDIEEVIFLINLDTGCQNVLEVHNANGSIRSDIKGRTDIDQAANLLVYYYE